MSGWIKIEKDLPASIRFRRVVTRLKERNALPGVTDCDDAMLTTLLLGALMRLWIYADTHIAADNTIEGTAEEIDALVGLPGFTQSMPDDWLVERGGGLVELPDFLEKNGTSAKQRQDAARRQAEFRHRRKLHGVTDMSRDVTQRNARNDARPDQKRPEETRPEERKNARARARAPRETTDPTRAAFLRAQAAYPAGTYPASVWINAEREFYRRCEEGATPDELELAAAAYAQQQQACGNVGQQFVRSPAKFYDAEGMWRGPFPIPKTKAEVAQDANLTATQQWLSGART
jgi:hypothetical protein